MKRKTQCLATRLPSPPGRGAGREGVCAKKPSRESRSMSARPAKPAPARAKKERRECNIVLPFLLDPHVRPTSPTAFGEQEARKTLEKLRFSYVLPTCATH